MLKIKNKVKIIFLIMTGVFEIPLIILFHLINMRIIKTKSVLNPDNKKVKEVIIRLKKL